jgi:hypothetical protein
MNDAQRAADAAATAGTTAVAPMRETWRAALFNRRMLICIFTGLSSGLPLYLPSIQRVAALGQST